jgi:hypothetical protein
MTLVRLVELVLVARRDFAGRADRWDAFMEVVRRTQTGRFVFPALAVAERLAPGTVDPPVLEEIAARAPAGLRRRVRHLTPGSAQRLHPYPFGERFIWAASLKEVVAALGEVAWPRVGNRLAPPRQVFSVQWRRIRKQFFRIMGNDVSP